MPTFRGFILQPTYRVESGVPVLHLFGRLEDGRPFLVRDRRRVPCFYVERDDAERAREKGALRQEATDQVTLLGRPVVRIEVQEPADAPPLRDRLTKAGIPTHEADVRFAMRHLIDRWHPGFPRDPRRGTRGAWSRPRVRGSRDRPRRLDAAALRSLARHRDRSHGATPARHRPSRVWRLGGAPADASGPRVPGRGTPLRDREGPAGGALRPRARAGSRRAHRLEPGRLRPDRARSAGLPARRAARGGPGARDPPPPRPGRGAGLAPSDDSRPRRSRRDPPPARLFRPDGRLRPRRGGALRARRGQDPGRPRPRRGDPASLRGGPGAPRPVQPHRRPPRPRDPRAPAPRRARGRAQPPHRPPPRPRRLLDRRLRLSLPRRARAAADRGPQRPRGGRDRGAPERRARTRACSRASTRTSSCWTSRASTRASSAPSRSTP